MDRNPDSQGQGRTLVRWCAILLLTVTFPLAAGLSGEPIEARIDATGPAFVAGNFTVASQASEWIPSFDDTDSATWSLDLQGGLFVRVFERQEAFAGAYSTTLVTAAVYRMLANTSADPNTADPVQEVWNGTASSILAMDIVPPNRRPANDHPVNFFGPRPGEETFSITAALEAFQVSRPTRPEFYFPEDSVHGYDRHHEAASIHLGRAVAASAYELENAIAVFAGPDVQVHDSEGRVRPYPTGIISDGSSGTPDGDAELMVRRYVVVEMPSAHATLDDPSFTWELAAQKLDIMGNGNMTFIGAEANITGPHEVDAALNSLQIEGNFTAHVALPDDEASQLISTDNGPSTRHVWQINGEATRIALDGQTRWLHRVAPVVGVGGALALLVLARPIAALLLGSRTPSWLAADLLGSVPRIRLLRRLHELGPSSVQDLAASVGISTSTTRYHLRMLQATGVVRVLPSPGKATIYATTAQATHAEPWPTGEVASRIKQALCAQTAPLNAADITLHLDRYGIKVSRSTLSYHLTRLHGLGLIQETREGRQKTYSLVKREDMQAGALIDILPSRFATRARDVQSGARCSKRERTILTLLGLIESPSSRHERMGARA